MISEIASSMVKLIRGEIPTKALKKRGLTVGKNFSRQGQCIIDPSHCWLIEIGDNVTLAPGVHILAHDASTKKYLGYTKIGEVIIGNNVFIGAKSIILPGIKIGDNSIIGAGSIVTKNVASNTVVAGNPARQICTTNEYITKMKSKISDKNKFDYSYTLKGRITDDKKINMKNRIKNGIGFVR